MGKFKELSTDEKLTLLEERKKNILRTPIGNEACNENIKDNVRYDTDFNKRLNKKNKEEMEELLNE